MKRTLTTLTVIMAIVTSVFFGTVSVGAVSTFKVSGKYVDILDNPKAGIEMKWTAVDGAEIYQIQSKKVDEKKYSYLTHTAYTEHGITRPIDTNKYHYRVVALNSDKKAIAVSNKLIVTGTGKPLSLPNTTTTPATTTVTVTFEETATQKETTPPTDTTPTKDTEVDTDAMAYEVFELVNEERAKAGLSQVVWDEELFECAKIRAEELSIKFSHERPTQPKVDKKWVKNTSGGGYYTAPSVADELGYSYVWIMENAAMGQKTAEHAVECWMDSAGHRKNILKNSHTRCAVGCYFDEDGTGHWALWFDSTPKS